MQYQTGEQHRGRGQSLKKDWLDDPKFLLMKEIPEKVRQERLRNGYCSTCRLSPTQCYEVKKKKFLGRTSRNPLTVSGVVHNGICLKCFPEQDPNRSHRRRKSHRRHNSHDSQQNGKSSSGSNAHFRSLSSSMERQGGERNLGLLVSPERVESSKVIREVASETKLNIFGEPVKEEKHRKKRHQHKNGKKDIDNYEQRVTENEITNDSEHSDRSEPNPLNTKAAHDSMQESTGPANDDNNIGNEENEPTKSDNDVLSGRIQNLLNNLPSKQDESDELAKLVALYLQNNPELIPKFAPGVNFLPNSELALPGMNNDDVSVISEITMETLARAVSSRSLGSSSHGSDARKQAAPIESSVSGHILANEQSVPASNNGFREPLPAISESSQHSLDTMSQQQSMSAESSSRSSASQRISDPPDPPPTTSKSATDLTELRNLVASFTESGGDETAIEVVTEELITDNATNKSIDLAVFCLTTLWVLARKSDENRHKILFGGCNFEVIIESMGIHRETSPDVLNRGCGILWTLSMNPDDRKHVAQLGGCGAILKAMENFMNNDSIQVMGIGALKVLACDRDGKCNLIRDNARSIVAESMAIHIEHEKIQSDGCAVLCNLAMDENRFVQTANEKEVSAVINAILAHPDSLEVHDNACFTLLNFASSTANLETIKQNQRTKSALNLAGLKHPDVVGEDVQILFGRLGIDSKDNHDDQLLPL